MRPAPIGSKRARASGLVLVLLAAGLHAESARADSADLVEAGRRLYQEGVLPDGTALVGARPEGLVFEGERAACATCHRRSGMGSVEGTGDQAILVPPLAGPVLFTPARFAEHELDEAHHYVPNATWRRAMKRRAYDERSLSSALREGRNPMGEPLEAPMPRYTLDQRSLNALTAYLRTLGSTADAGAEGDEVHVGLVVAADADPADTRVVLDVVRAWMKAPVRYGGRPTGYPKPIRLHEWRLSGPAESWSKQLEDAYQRQAVFALVSGMGRAEWRPVQEFCERRRVPCVLPSIDVAPDEVGYYGMYFSRGVELEARILAEHLASKPLTSTVIQIYGDAAGREAARELSRTLRQSGIEARTRRFRAIAPHMSLAGIDEDDVIVIWLRSEALALLAGEAPSGPVAERIYLSAMLATPQHVTLPERWRNRVRFVSLDDEVSVQQEIARLRLSRWLDKRGIGSNGDPRVQADAYAAGYLFSAALARITQQEVRRPPVPLTGEHVLEELETLVSRRADGRDVIDEDLHVAHYGRMSLGPNQRIATRGGSIMRLAGPESGRLIRVSDRITPR